MFNFPPLVNVRLSDLIDSTLGNGSPIYSGIPINSNAQPLSLDSNEPIRGGYSGDGSVQEVEVVEDGCCEELVEEVVPMDGACEIECDGEAMSQEAVDCEPCEGETPHLPAPHFSKDSG